MDRIPSRPTPLAWAGQFLLYGVFALVIGVFSRWPQYRHLEDNQGAVLQVKLPVGQKVCMARMIDDAAMLFSTGDAIDSPLVDRGCRSKLTVRVPHPEKFLENWSCGLHRVIFYGDHVAGIERMGRLMGFEVVKEM